MWSMTSFAHTPARKRPVSVKRAVGGTRTRTSRVSHALAMSVEPTPNAKQPRAPAMHVWLSVPTTTCPGSAELLDHFVVADAFGADDLSVPPHFAVTLTPSRSPNASCTDASLRAWTSSPMSLCALDMTRSSSVR